MVSIPMAVTTDGAWHGVVPAGWSLKQLKWAVTFQRGHDLPTEDRQAGPIPVVTGGGITGWHNVAQARGPGIVTGRYGTIGEFYLVEQDYWPLNTSLYSIDLHGNHAGFLRYMLEPLAPLFHLNAAKSAVPGIDRSDIHTIPVAVPPLATQRAIAAYLNRETVRLDGLVAAKERVLGLVAEKRRSLITRAVTRGLDPRAPLRDSGIPWLGEIPAHWKIIQLKFVTRSLQTGPFGSQLHAEEYITGGVPVVNPSHLNSGRICADNRVSVDEATAERLVIHRLSPGDVVFARRGELGRCGVVEPSQAGWLCGTGSLRARLRLDMVDPYYLVLVFTETRLSDVLTFESVGSTMDNLNTEILGSCQFGVPPLTEQRGIVAHIAADTAKLDALFAVTERTIALLKERRAALIAAAVTGHIQMEGTA